MRKHLAGLALCAVVALGGEARANLVVAGPPCSDGEAYVHVRAIEHALYLCEAGKAQASYPVTLGSAAGAKAREGDRRTPRGRYALLPARRSDKFAWFVEVGYPTRAQRARGYTGSAVGIHGPPRRAAQLGLGIPRWILALDWTRGCIAVGSDAEIEAIVAWLARSHARVVVID